MAYAKRAAPALVITLPLLLAGPGEVRGQDPAVFVPWLDEAEWRAAGQDPALFFDLVGRLNRTIRPPGPVIVAGRDCGGSVAYFAAGDGMASHLALCAEFVGWLARETGADPATLEDILGFILLHEAGHAVIRLADLPITGREEDVVDQFAVLYSLARDGPEPAVLGAHLFRLLARDSLALEDFADEHSLGLQRYYNLLCWVYGSDPERYQGLAFNEVLPLPRSRAVRCPAEWARFQPGLDETFGDAERVHPFRGPFLIPRWEIPPLEIILPRLLRTRITWQTPPLSPRSCQELGVLAAPGRFSNLSSTVLPASYRRQVAPMWAGCPASPLDDPTGAGGLLSLKPWDLLYGDTAGWLTIGSCQFSVTSLDLEDRTWLEVSRVPPGRDTRQLSGDVTCIEGSGPAGAPVVTARGTWSTAPFR